MNRKWKQVSPIERLGRWRVPQATMNRRGDIKLSRVAWEMLERPPYVYVLYEPSTRTIGLRPSNSHIKDTFPLKPDGLYGAQMLNVACLRIDHKVVAEHTLRFQDVRLDGEGTLILELDRATPAYHGHRVGAYHNERKVRLERQRQPHPHWLAESTGPQASRLQPLDNEPAIQSVSETPHASETLAVQSGSEPEAIATGF